MHKTLHHHIRKHIRKHKKKYFRFLLIFVALVLYGSLDNIIAIYFVHDETPLKIFAIAILISATFTGIAEIIEIIWKKMKK